MRDVDLGDVPPLLRARTRRRIRAIRDYLSPTKHEAFTAKWFAKELGISESHFRALVKIWKQHQNALAVSGGGRPSPPTHTASADRPALPAELGELVDQIARDAGRNASFPEIMRRLAKQCAARGIPRPTPGKIARHLSLARKPQDAGLASPEEGGEPSLPEAYRGPPLLAVLHLAVDLRIDEGGGQIVTPIVSVGILLPERFIVSHALSSATNLAPAAASVLVKALAMSTAGSHQRPILYSTDEDADWEKIEQALESSGVIRTDAPTNALEAALGGRLGALPVRARERYLPFRKHQVQPSGEPIVLPLIKATALIAGAVAAHNRTLAQGIPEAIPRFAITPESTSSSLRFRLASIARRRPKRPR